MEFLTITPACAVPSRITRADQLAVLEHHIRCALGIADQLEMFAIGAQIDEALEGLKCEI